MTRTALCEFRGKLHTLRFTTRQRRCRLAKPDVAQADIDQSLHVSGNDRLVREEINSLSNWHIQNVSDRLTLEHDVKSVSVISRALTNLTLNIHIGQEVHFDFDGSITRAGFTSSALHVERKTSWHVTTNFCLSRRCKELSNIVKHPGVRCGVRPWGTTNR